jgi:hypothetical protein
MAYGDHLQATRGGYHHDGIDLGDGRIIHFAAPAGGSKAEACIRVDTIDLFRGDGDIVIRAYADHIDPQAAVQRAWSSLGQSGYDLGFNNCEHFAHWCVTGEHRSEQVVQVASTTGSFGTAAASAALGIDLIASSGIVTNLSGPGILSGLKATGALVGAGCVGGLVLLSATPTGLSNVIVHRALRDSPTDSDEERHARAVGRASGIGGGVVGIGVGILAVSALGVAGLSGAGISSGLATVGSAVGGGMAAGVVTLMVVPVVLTLLLAYFAYGATKPGATPYVSKATGI